MVLRNPATDRRLPCQVLAESSERAPNDIIFAPPMSTSVHWRFLMFIPTRRLMELFSFCWSVVRTNIPLPQDHHNCDPHACERDGAALFERCGRVEELARIEDRLETYGFAAHTSGAVGTDLWPKRKQSSVHANIFPVHSLLILALY